MSGYLGDEEATRRTFFPGGWLRTGDSGRLDPTRGCLTLEDRIKDMIIRGGSNIYPREATNFETSLLVIQHLPTRGD